MKNPLNYVLFSFAIAALTACGGGGSDSAPASTSNTTTTTTTPSTTTAGIPATPGKANCKPSIIGVSIQASAVADKLFTADVGNCALAGETFKINADLSGEFTSATGVKVTFTSKEINDAMVSPGAGKNGGLVSIGIYKATINNVPKFTVFLGIYDGRNPQTIGTYTAQ